ncbi:MAG: RNA-directed DNA polymerase [Bacteroides sp.]|nr:RNA-directed DNA polymerase [Bacteroidales bacterium]MBD5291244.1 RNA-directed DNA polymerase [Bacteroides sp.]
MEKLDLTEKLKNINTAEQLATVLDEIKQIEFGSVRYSISVKMLRHFSSDTIAPKRFRTFHIRKKSRGLREIKAPCKQLDVILTCVNILLKSIYEPSDVVMGFTSGRSVLNNAQVHIGHNYVFNIDLKDFFPSIPQARVWKRLQLAPFNFSQEIANILAGLCCSYDANVKANVLPQGSPASPLLTNAICDKLDRRMKGVAKRFGLHYSRYADDMTFSSMHNVYQEGSEFRLEIQRIVSDQGFRMNDSKTRLQKTGSRQEVTGLTVNAIANVSRKYLSDLRWILHVWEKEGYAKAYAIFYPKYKDEKGYIKKGEPVMENVISGKLNYLRMVRGENNPAYRKLQARYDSLQELVFVDNETDKSKSYVYVQPYTVVDFEELFKTKLTLTVTRDKKLVGKCEIDNREKTLAISKTTQKLLCDNLDNLNAGDIVHSEELSECYVTLCRHKGKNFWLITKFEPKRSRCLSIQNLRIAPEEILDYWEKYGIEKTTEKLVLFVQFANPGDSLKDWNPSENSEHTIDRGSFKISKDDLIVFFLKNKNVTSLQRKKAMQLMIDSIPVNRYSENIDIEKLLDIWEEEGLDAAVLAWKEMSKINKSKPISHKKKANTKNQSSQDTFLEEIGISEEELASIQQEMAKCGGKPIGKPIAGSYSLV